MQTTIFTVSELNLAAQSILEGHFSNIIVEGEISNLAKPSSGHLYFSLKDAKAQIRCAFFRQYSRAINFELQNGLLVQVTAKVSIYPDRGDYQLIVESITLAGDGLLRIAYEKLLKQLSGEGLFEDRYKKPIPKMPKHITVITSPTGAAIRDIVSVLKRRFSSIPITIIPALVQGTLAAKDIVKALTKATKLNTDVIILARGGGSLEDLWPFNEEIVARAIFACPIPIVSGVGHETDFTIADFVADKRAPTPSAAAELVSPDSLEWIKRFGLYESRLKNEINKYINYRSQQLDHLLKRLRHPGLQIKMQKERLIALKNRLFLSMNQMFKEQEQRADNLFKALHMVSPLATLKRGYSIVSKESIVRSVLETKPGDLLKIRMADGEVYSTVERIKELEFEQNIF